MIHYHMCDIGPLDQFFTLAGRHFLVNYFYRTNTQRCHQIGQSVMLDNGAFGAWRSGKTVDWPGFYRWCEKWLQFPSTWAIPPDVIDAPSEVQDALLSEWPHGRRQAAPVWHIDEPVERLCRLIDAGWFRVCIGSTGKFARVLSDLWCWRMDHVWEVIVHVFGKTPPIHMLRGMACSGKRWPFISVDSSDIARNHNRPQNTALSMAMRWDAIQCPDIWTPPPLIMQSRYIALHIPGRSIS